MARIAVDHRVRRADAEHHCRRFDLPAGYGRSLGVLAARVLHERVDLCVAGAVGAVAAADLPVQALSGSCLCAAHQEVGRRAAMVAAGPGSSSATAAGVLPEMWPALECWSDRVPVVRGIGLVKWRADKAFPGIESERTHLSFIVIWQTPIPKL